MITMREAVTKYGNTLDTCRVLIDLGKADEQSSKTTEEAVIGLIVSNPEWYYNAVSRDDFMAAFGESLWEVMTPEEQQEAPKKVNKKTGAVKYKFRSWAPTKVKWQYAGYIWKAMENLSGDEEKSGFKKLFESSEELPTMKYIRECATTPKTNLEKLQQAVKTTKTLLDKVLDDMTDEDERRNLVMDINTKLFEGIN